MTGQSRRSRTLARSSSRTPHFLYRCYDRDGLLVYIGCSSDPRRRMEHHRAGRNATSRLIQQYAVRFEVDTDAYYSRDAARDAEAVAIHAEQPLFNIQHRCDSWASIKRQIEDYEAGRSVRRWASPLPSRRVLEAIKRAT